MRRLILSVPTAIVLSLAGASWAVAQSSDAGDKPAGTDTPAPDSKETPAPAETPEPTPVATPAPEPAPRSTAKPMSPFQAGASKHKGFVLTSDDGDFTLKAKGLMQARFAYEDVDGGANMSAFSLPRARIAFSGHMWGKEINYKFQSDFGKGFVALKDFYVDYKALDGVKVRLGQFKKPFSRQQLNSSSRLELVDRSITDKAFGAGRDVGLMVHNGSKSNVEWAAGIFNGTGEKGHFSGTTTVDPMTGEGTTTGGFSNVPSNVKPAVVLRGGYNQGIKGYSEADLEGGGLRYGVAASILSVFDADAGDDAGTAAEVDYALKMAGASVSGAFYTAMAQASEDTLDQEQSMWGLHVQAGYVWMGWIQPVVRFALLDPDGDDNNVTELTGGLSLYLHKHRLKWQTDVSALTMEAIDDDVVDYRVRTQAQLAF